MKIVGVDGEDSIGSHKMRFAAEICSGDWIKRCSRCVECHA